MGGQRARGGAVVVAAALALAPPAAAQQAPASPPPPDLAALRALGARTARQLEARAAEWTSFYAWDVGYVVVHVVHAPPGRRRFDVALEQGGQRTAVATIVERDGAWFVAEAEGASGVWRAWEAPLRLTFLLDPLAHAQRPETFADVQGDPGALQKVEGGAATWAVEAPDAPFEALTRAQAELKRWLAGDPKRRTDPGAQARVRLVERLERELFEGTLTRADLASGLLLVAGPPGQRRALSGFRWLDAVPEELLAVAGAAPPVDGRGDPLAGAGPGDLVLLAGCGYAGPDLQPGATLLDARLVDLRTGAARRLPLPGQPAIPGAWSRDRARVYAVGADGGLWEVALRTGRVRRLGGAPLRAGACSFPALSADGRTLAVVHRAPGGTAGQVHVIDLGDDAAAARPLGPPLDAGRLAWAPGGQLVVAVRGARGDELALLDPAGGLSTLRPGAAPLLLGDGATVAFLDPAAGLWLQAGLTPGAATRPLLDGLRGHVAPALSPDGARLLAIDPEGAPVLLDLATGARAPVPVGPGLWAHPVWR